MARALHSHPDLDREGRDEPKSSARGAKRHPNLPLVYGIVAVLIVIVL